MVQQGLDPFLIEPEAAEEIAKLAHQPPDLRVALDQRRLVECKG
jgi:hypothetical protein